MSTFRNPVGPQSSKVYWRRRLLVLLGAVAVIIVVVLIVAPRGSGEPTGGASSNETASEPSPSATPEDEAVEGADCNPESVTVVAVTDKNSYAAGELPQLSFTITNTSGTACTYNVGSTQQTFEITSGEELYWSSKDCETAPVDAPLLLEPNVAQNSQPIPWDRTRSSATTCEAQRPAVTAGGATYNLSVSVGAAKSEVPSSFLLH